MTTEEAVNRFLNSRLAQPASPRTIAFYRYRFAPFLRQFRELPTSPDELESYLGSQTGAPSTKLANYRSLAALYHFLELRYRFPNPMRVLQAPRIRRQIRPTLEYSQLFLLLQTPSSLRDRAILTLLEDSGIRVSEMVGLRKGDMLGELLLVSGKTGQRLVPVSQETRDLLARVSGESPGDYIFAGRRGPLSRAQVYNIVSRALRAASVSGPKLGPHRIRHAFGKGYLVAGGDLRSLQQILGHSRISTTELYSSLSMQDTIDKHHRFTPLRAAHGAAQGSLFSGGTALQEAEQILRTKEAND